MVVEVFSFIQDYFDKSFSLELECNRRQLATNDGISNKGEREICEWKQVLVVFEYVTYSMQCAHIVVRQGFSGLS